MALPNDTATRIVRAIIAEKKIYETANQGKQYTLGPASEVARRVLQKEADENTLSPLPAGFKAVPKPKPRDPIFDALAIASGFDLATITRPAAGRIAKAKADIIAVSPNVTPEQIADAAKALAKKYQGAPVTPTSISSHWAEFRSESVKVVKITAPAGWLAVLREMYPTSIYFQAGGQFEIKAESDAGWSQIPASVRMAIEKEMKR